MKISKLFHCLYAFLMFLPIFAIAVKCGYVMLNKNAQDSYSGIYSYESTLSLKQYYPSINNIDDWTATSISDWNYITINYSSLNLITDNSHTNFGQTWFSIDPNSFSDNVKSQFSSSQLSNIKTLYLNGNSTSYNLLFFTFDLSSVDHNPSWDIPIKSINNFTENIYFQLTDNKIYARGQFVTSSYVFQFLYSISYVVDTNLSSVFYSALQELDNVEFFSWAKNSFLSEPFMYIGNLFGIPNVHPIFTFLSYWMSISVIWLVFDVFMYVPLLAHKWIDKGKVD